MDTELKSGVLFHSRSPKSEEGEGIWENMIKKKC